MTQTITIRHDGTETCYPIEEIREPQHMTIVEIKNKNLRLKESLGKWELLTLRDDGYPVRRESVVLVSGPE